MTDDPAVLAFDTATRLGTVAVARGRELLAEVTLGVTARHAESLLPAIDFVVAQTGLSRADLGAIIVGSGPGSFTGVRIAGATAKGLAHALHIPLHAVSSLTMLAAGAGVPGPVCALFDARRGEVYAACHRFRQDADIAPEETLLAPSASHLETVIEELRQHDPLYIGEGALRYADRLRAAGARVGSPVLATARASALLSLYQSGSARNVEDPRRWTPDYLRAPAVTVPADMRRRAGTHR